MTLRDDTKSDFASTAVPGRRFVRDVTRRRVGAVALLVACASCGPQAGQHDPSGAFAVDEMPADSSVERSESTPTSTSTIPQRSIGSRQSHATTERLDQNTTSSSTRCSLEEIGFEQLLVFGNSTDYTFRADEPIDMTAWPELLVLHDQVGLLDGVAVRNEAQPGQTMGSWDSWGPDPRLRLNGYAPTVLDSVEPRLLQTTLVLVAPSFIDLQESAFDVVRAITDLTVVLATIEAYGLRALVLPMNYVSNTVDDLLPDLNPSIERFNQALVERGLLAEPHVDSPLRNRGDDVGGDERFYDDFPGRDRDGLFLGADGFHPDPEGQLVKTLSVLEILATLVERTNPPADCLKL
jgi:hypothetical protein